MFQVRSSIFACSFEKLGLIQFWCNQTLLEEFDPDRQSLPPLGLCRILRNEPHFEVALLRR